MCHISPKAFPKECCIVVLINDPSFLFIDLKQAIVSISGRLSPHSFEMFSISPLQAYSFRCWFFQQLHSNLLGRVLSKIIGGRSWHFLLRSFPSINLSSILSSGGIVMLLSSPIISFCQDHILFMLTHLTGVLSSHSSSFILLSLASLQPE